MLTRCLRLVCCRRHRLYDNYAQQIRTWYTRGLGLSSRLSGPPHWDYPVFLFWQPEPGYEEDRLWRKGWTWALVMGLGWLPILVCMAMCFN